MIPVEPEELEKTLNKSEDLQIIDIRTFREFKESHLEQAVCIPRDSFAQYMNKIQKHIPIFVYCNYGMKSDEIALFLEKKFKSKVYVLQGGYDAYLEYVNQRK